MTAINTSKRIMVYSTFAIVSAFTLAGCSDPTKTDASSTPINGGSIDLASFATDALMKPAEIVDCTLTTGEAAKCAKVTVKYKPDGLELGPTCPQTVEVVGGIWNWDGRDAGLYRIDGTFLKMLKDQGYEFYGSDGKVHISTDLSMKPAFTNACLSVTADPAVIVTILLPMAPKMATTDTQLGTVAKIGLALDGVPIFADAPSVLQTGHMPALDTCGGHIDPGGWFHWHATVTDINGIYASKKVDATCSVTQSASAQFAYAFDGYPMYGTTDSDGIVPSDLDECNGHTGATSRSTTGEYHYHATSNFPNLPACLKGVQANENFSTTAKSGLGSANGGGGPGGGAPAGKADGGSGGPDFSQAAGTLGITEQALKNAMEATGGPNANLVDVAKTLNVDEAALAAALPKPKN
jgi:YHYH protein